MANVTTEELQKQLEALAEGMGTNVREYVQSQGFADEQEVLSRFNEVNKKIDAITEMDDNGVESLAEKIKSLKDLLANEDGVVQGLVDKINANAKGIEDIKAGTDTNFKKLQDALNANGVKIDDALEKIDNLKVSVSDLDKKIDEKIAETKTSVENLQSEIDTLTGDATVEGSIAKQIADESNRTNVSIEQAKQTAIDEAKKYADDKIESLDLASNEEISKLKDRTASVESVLNDSTDDNGNLVKGLKTKVEETSTGLSKEISDRVAAVEKALNDAKAYTDANTLKADDVDVKVVIDKFANALLGKTTTDNGEAL